MNANQIKECSYPDFVAFIGQENCPPGGRQTIQEWCQWGKIGPDSYVLDLACSTGFSSRHATALTGCRSMGIDLSPLAISQALKKRPPEKVQQLEYRQADACKLPFPDHTFSHVLAGCNFGFIGKRREALSEVTRVLLPGGVLCIATHCFTGIPPENLLDDIADKIGFRPEPMWTKDYWDKFFSRQLQLMHVFSFDLPVVPNDLLEQKVRGFCDTSLTHLLPEEREICLQRLLKTRKTINQMRQYQNYIVSLWQKADV